MRKFLAFLLPISVLINPTSDCFADVNPITVTYNSGNTTFSTSSSGTANYVVSVNNAVTPKNAPLLFHLNNTGAISGLVATQITTGAASCIGVDSLCGSAFPLQSGDSCCLAFSLTSQTSGNYSLQPTVSTSPSTYSGQAPSALPITVLKNTTPTLSVSKNELALSITGLTLNSEPSGKPRRFVVSNTGGVPVTGIYITEPSWPTDTAMTTSCGSTLALEQTCTITITPGSSATSNCTTGIVPDPSVITLSADGITPINLNVVILGYGCIYQEGYIFSMDDSTLPTRSIGGTVAAQSDYSETPIWGSNSHGITSSDISYDLIPGIGDASTTSSGVPSFSDFAGYFSTTYTTSLELTPADFRQCNGKSDGRCNTANIVTFYNYYQTNYDVNTPPPYTPTVASTPATDYPAGVCYTYNSGTYQDWYLPAVCELSVDNPITYPGRFFPGCGTADAPLMQNIEQNLYILGVGNLTHLFYWSSTETTPYDPVVYAWNALMFPIDLTLIGGGDKSDQNTAVRCVRALS